MPCAPMATGRSPSLTQRRLTTRRQNQFMHRAPGVAKRSCRYDREPSVKSLQCCVSNKRRRYLAYHFRSSRTTQLDDAPSPAVSFRNNASSNSAAMRRFGNIASGDHAVVAGAREHRQRRPSYVGGGIGNCRQRSKTSLWVGIQYGYGRSVLHW